MREAIETAPKTGVFVILEDAAQGTFGVARWSAERAQWVDLDGAPSRLNPTHWEFPQTVDELVTSARRNAIEWRSPASAQGFAATADNLGSPASLGKPPSRRAHHGTSGLIAAYERATAIGGDLDAIVIVGSGDGAVARAAPDHDVAGEDRGHGIAVTAPSDVGAGDGADRVAVTGAKDEAAVARPAPVGLTAQPRQVAEPERSVTASTGSVDPVGNGYGKSPSVFAVAGSWIVRRQRGIATMAAGLVVGVALGMLASELVAARREVQSQLSVVDSAKAQIADVKEAAERSADEHRRALQQERDKAEKLAADLAEAKSSLEALTKAKAQVAGVKDAAERSADEQRRALQQERDKVETLTAALAQAKLSLDAQAQAADGQRRALQQERDKAEKLAAELAQARSSLDTQAQAADGQRRALQQERDKAEKLAAELAQARSSLDTRTQAVDEQRRALQRERDKAEKLAAELAQAKSSLDALAKAKTADVKEAAERNADEQRRALEQERDKAEKLAAALAQARSSLEALTKAKAADDVARDDQLATLRGELRKATADAATTRAVLEAEYARREQMERRLAAIQATVRDQASRPPAAPAPIVSQPLPAAPAVADARSTAPTEGVARPASSPTPSQARVEPGNPHAVRLIARANLLLDQGNIGAARNMLDQAAAMGSAEALFWLAETYDPLLLSARKTVGTQSDIAKARELYGKALAGGISEAKSRLEALRQ